MIYSYDILDFVCLKNVPSGLGPVCSNKKYVIVNEIERFQFKNGQLFLII